MPRSSVASRVISRKTPTRPNVAAHAPTKVGRQQRRTSTITEAVGKILDEKLQPLHEALIELTAEMRPATQRKNSAYLDRRKKIIAGIISSRKSYLKMSEILAEADKLQQSFPQFPHYRPVRSWKVRFWSDMKGDNRAQSYISKIRADPGYLPSEHLSELGKKRFKMNREYRNE